MPAFTTPTYLERLQAHPILRDPGESFQWKWLLLRHSSPPPPSLTAPGSLRITPSLSPKLYSSPIAFGYYYWIYSIYFTYELVFPTKRRMGFLDAQVPELINKSDNGLQIHLTFISLSNIHVLLTWSD